ncbi:MAG: thiamine pyrophosphate-dependent enzyme, partial [Thermoplasmata archaeon]
VRPTTSGRSSRPRLISSSMRSAFSTDGIKQLLEYRTVGLQTWNGILHGTANPFTAVKPAGNLSRVTNHSLERGEQPAVRWLRIRPEVTHTRLMGRVDTLHTTHGRAIPHALGIKLGDRDLEVVVVAGDGDCAGIGGNHLMHAARSNIGITVLMINNGLYAMTGGQAGPTTEHGEKTLTTPYGNPAGGLEVAEVVKAAGGAHVARWTTYHMRELIKEIGHAFSKEGFSFIEVLSQCPTRTGKKFGLSGPDMLEWYRDNTSKDPESDKMFVGRMADETKHELSNEIYKQIRDCGGGPR